MIRISIRIARSQAAKIQRMSVSMNGRIYLGILSLQLAGYQRLST